MTTAGRRRDAVPGRYGNVHYKLVGRSHGTGRQGCRAVAFVVQRGGFDLASAEPDVNARQLLSARSAVAPEEATGAVGCFVLATLPEGLVKRSLRACT